MPPIARFTHSVLSTTERTIQLDASTSEDPEGGILTYSWFNGGVRGIDISRPFTADSIITISSTFTSPNMYITLTVTDNEGLFGRLQKIIPNPFTQSSPPSGTIGGVINILGEPTIFAGHDQLVYSTEEITLTAEIYTDIKVKSYLWQRVGGTLNKQVTLSNNNTKTATFTADTLVSGDDDVIHTFLLTVTDSDDNIYTDNIRITVRDISLKPITIDAGENQTVDSLATVKLNASNTYIPDGETVTYSWTILENNYIKIKNKNRATASFTAPIVESTYVDIQKTYTAQLTITDSNKNVYTDIVLIDVRRQNLVGLAPVARISPNTLTVSSGETVTLDASTSTDFDSGTISSYKWERIGGTGNNITLNGITKNTLSFTAETLTIRDIPVNYIIRLIVIDDNMNSDSEVITVNVTPPNSIGSSDIILSANAGPNIYTFSGNLVQLDGTDSTGNISTYLWERVGGTGNPNISLSNPNIVNPTFTAGHSY